MIVFKLERERPAYAVHGSVLYYVKDRYLRTHDLAQGRDNPLIALRRPPTTTLNSAPRTLSYNPAEHAVLITRWGAWAGGTSWSWDDFTSPP